MTLAKHHCQSRTDAYAVRTRQNEFHRCSSHKRGAVDTCKVVVNQKNTLPTDLKVHRTNNLDLKVHRTSNQVTLCKTYCSVHTCKVVVNHMSTLPTDLKVQRASN